jgi:hypothetical protein
MAFTSTGAVVAAGTDAEAADCDEAAGDSARMISNMHTSSISPRTWLVDRSSDIVEYIGERSDLDVFQIRTIGSPQLELAGAFVPDRRSQARQVRFVGDGSEGERDMLAVLVSVTGIDFDSLAGFRRKRSARRILVFRSRCTLVWCQAYRQTKSCCIRATNRPDGRDRSPWDNQLVVSSHDREPAYSSGSWFSYRHSLLASSCIDLARGAHFANWSPTPWPTPHCSMAAAKVEGTHCDRSASPNRYLHPTYTIDKICMICVPCSVSMG